MSLKAKLEAVIYAAEEPVTLAQLALLFTADALEWKAEQEAAAPPAEPAEAVLAEAEPTATHDAETTASEPVEEPAPEPVAESAPESAEAPAELAAEGEDAAIDVATPEADAESDEPDAGEPGADPESASSEETEAAAAAALKREARLRDKQVREILRQLLDELIAEYAADSRGVEIREIAGGYRMATKPECHDAVRSFVKSLKPALKLSLPALETLAVIAYKQPVTAPEVNEIRGVDSSGVFGSLLARKLIATAGRKPVIGRPILYKTTKEFLLRFGLKDVTELPSMEEFEKMAAMELDEPEIVSEGEPTPEMREDLSLENDGPDPEATENESTETSQPETTSSESTTSTAEPQSE